ncbi:MAG: OmpL47-type beta-barrel domain-containing protein [Thermoplasmatota archaeon]
MSSRGSDVGRGRVIGTGTLLAVGFLLVAVGLLAHAVPTGTGGPGVPWVLIAPEWSSGHGDAVNYTVTIGYPPSNSGSSIVALNITSDPAFGTFEAIRNGSASTNGCADAPHAPGVYHSFLIECGISDNGVATQPGAGLQSGNSYAFIVQVINPAHDGIFHWRVNATFGNGSMRWLAPFQKYPGPIANSGNSGIDGVAPNTTFAPGAVGQNGWIVSKTGNLTCTDATSGCAFIDAVADNQAEGKWAPPNGILAIPLPDGQYALSFNSSDWAGNNGTVQPRSIKVDTMPPRTTLGFPAAPGSTVCTGAVCTAQGWFPSPIQFTLTCDDSNPAASAVSGCASTLYTLDNGSSTPYLSSVSESADGAHVLRYWSVDGAGNTESTHTLHFGIDTTSPRTVADCGGTTVACSSTAWYTTAPVSVNLVCDDRNGSVSVSGCASTFARIDNGSPSSVQVPILFHTDGVHTMSFWSVDNAGNEGPVQQVTLHIDTTAPSTTAACIPKSCSTNQWFDGPVAVNLSCSDQNATLSVSGCAATSYSVDGGAWTTYGALPSFTVDGDGAHTISFQSRDLAGNVETPSNLTVKIDTRHPTTTAWCGSQLCRTAGWLTSPTNVSFVCSDANGSLPTSGCNSTFVTLGGSPLLYLSGTNLSLTKDGNYTITFASADAAGNVEPTQNITLRLDQTAPESTASENGTAGANGWYTGPVLVTLRCADGGSGCAQIAYSLDGNATTRMPYSGPLAIPIQTDGQHVLRYGAVDVAGNTEGGSRDPLPNSLTISIDSQAPMTTATTNPGQADGSDGWFRSSVSLTLTCADVSNGSGCNETLVSVDNGSYAPYKAPLSLGDGTHAIRFFSVDLAGNTELPQTLQIKQDTSAPTITAMYPQPGPQGWYTVAPTIRFTCADAGPGSGVVACPAAFRPGDGANQTFTVAASDGAGNVRYLTLPPLSVDTHAPSISASLSHGPNGAGWIVQATTVQFTCADPIAGIAANGCPGPLTIADGQAQTIIGVVTSRSGLTSQVTVGPLKVDTVAPVTTVTLDGPSIGAGKFNGSVTVAVSCSDATSGCAETNISIDGGPNTTVRAWPASFNISGDGNHTIRFASTDVAGNTETAADGTIALLGFAVDSAAPQDHVTIAGMQGQQGWFTSNVTIDIQCDDGTNGSGCASTTYTVDGGNPMTAPGSGPVSFNMDGDGNHSMTFYSRDAFGNTAPPSSIRVRIDASTPNTELATVPPAPDGEGGWFLRPVAIHLACMDEPEGSGCNDTYYRIDQGATTLYSAPFTIAADGFHNVTYWSTNVAGLQEAEHTFTARIDTRGPIVTLAVQGAPTNQGWYSGSSVVVRLACNSPAGIVESTCPSNVTISTSSIPIVQVRDEGGRVAKVNFPAIAFAPTVMTAESSGSISLQSLTSSSTLSPVPVTPGETVHVQAPCPTCTSANVYLATSGASPVLLGTLPANMTGPIKIPASLRAGTEASLIIRSVGPDGNVTEQDIPLAVQSAAQQGLGPTSAIALEILAVAVVLGICGVGGVWAYRVMRRK